MIRRSGLGEAMSPLLIAFLCLVMVGTSFLSGVFGMAGGMILVGVLLAIMPLPDAMALHGVTQMASNGWRGILWIRQVRWRVIAPYVLGVALAMLGWSFTQWVPSKPIALLFLGVTPFLVRLLPADLHPNPVNPLQGVLYGGICTTLMLLTGVSGPLLDTFFLGGGLDRKQIVATKAICQVFGHLAKLIYFGGLATQTAIADPLIAAFAIAASMLGTSLARRVLERMSDQQFRLWANRIITTVAGYYVLYGGYLLVAS